MYMLKRIFWLALAGVGGWLLYRIWQQRQEDFGGTTPLLAPLEPYGRHIPPPAPAAASAVTSPDTSPAPAAASPATSLAPAAPAPISPAPSEQPAARPEAAELESVSGYCARCKARRTISETHEETTESGRRAARGTCPVCGAKMFTFLPNKS
jgi:Domain of unknown function (DUF5679)